MRHVSLAQLTVSGSSPPDVVTAAAAAGFDAVGLRLEARLPHEEFPHQATRNPAMLGEIKRRLAQTGVQVSNVTGGYLTAQTRIEDLARLTDAGAALGARHVVMVSFDPDEARTIANLAALSEIAAKSGMKVALEFITYNVVSNLAQAWRIAKLTGDDNVGLMIDPLHLSRSGDSPAALGEIDKSRLFIAQLCDASGPTPPTEELRISEFRTARLYPGQGDLPLFEYLDRFPPTCDLEVEAPHPAHVAWGANERARAAADALQIFMRNYEASRADIAGKP